MKRVLLLMLLVLTYSVAAEEPLTNDDVIKLVNAGLTQDTIETKIFNSYTRFKTDADSMIDLTQRGVPDRVIRAMIARQAEQRPGAASSSSTTSSQPSAEARPAMGARFFDVAIHRTRTSRCDTGELRLDTAGAHARGCRPSDFDLYWNEITDVCYTYGTRGVVEFKTAKRKWRISTDTPADAREIMATIAEMRPSAKVSEGCP
jgi:hypothetical protein